MSEYYLSHHGIEGQKWGVRRFQYEDGKLTPAGIERYRKGGFDKNYTKANDDGLLVSDIPKGTMLYRVTDRKEKQTGSKYMTMFESDRDYYRSLGGSWIASKLNKKVSDLKEDQYVLTKDIKLPTVKQQNSIIEKTIINNEKNLEMSKYGFVEMRTGFDKYTVQALKDPKLLSYNPTLTYYSEKVKSLEEEFNKGIKSENAYERSFYATSGLTNEPNLKKALEKEFSKNNFDGMIDYAGVGGVGKYGRETKQAMIIFDTKKNLKYQKSKKLNEFLSNHAEENWYQWFDKHGQFN